MIKMIENFYVGQKDLKTEIFDLLVNYVFIAYQDDRFSLISHFSGSDGIRKLIHQILIDANWQEDMEERIYSRLTKILDEIATDTNSVISKKYIEMYNSSTLARAVDFWGEFEEK